MAAISHHLSHVAFDPFRLSCLPIALKATVLPTTGMSSHYQPSGVSEQLSLRPLTPGLVPLVTDSADVCMS
jgi:hypothetical protein